MLGATGHSRAGLAAEAGGSAKGTTHVGGAGAGDELVLRGAGLTAGPGGLLLSLRWQAVDSMEPDRRRQERRRIPLPPYHENALFAPSVPIEASQSVVARYSRQNALAGRYHGNGGLARSRVWWRCRPTSQQKGPRGQRGIELRCIDPRHVDAVSRRSDISLEHVRRRHAFDIHGSGLSSDHHPSVLR